MASAHVITAERLDVTRRVLIAKQVLVDTKTHAGKVLAQPVIANTPRGIRRRLRHGLVDEATHAEQRQHEAFRLVIAPGTLAAAAPPTEIALDQPVAEPHEPETSTRRSRQQP